MTSPDTLPILADPPLRAGLDPLPLPAEAVPWWTLRYQHLAALRAALLDAPRLDGRPHAPAWG